MTFDNVDDYIFSFSKEKREILIKIKKLIKKIAPKSEEVMIYGVAGSKLNKKNLIIYAAFNEHIGIYPEPDTIKYFKEELKSYKTSKGTIKFF